jgi:hypothetical protein
MRVAWALSDRGLAVMAAATGLRLGCTWPDAVCCLREGMGHRHIVNLMIGIEPHAALVTPDIFAPGRRS